MQNLKEELEKNIPDMLKWRHHLHQNPELSFHEVNTSNYIYDILTSFEVLEITRPTKTSVLAKLKGNAPGKKIMFRADIDALPIKEEADVEFKSVNDGVMHACGHDIHTTILLATVKTLCAFKNDIKGEIHFIFQHAEEQPPGGAKELVDLGILDGVDFIFGQHVIPEIPKGMLGFINGTFCASSNIFDITIKGKGGHAAMPNLAIDPIVIGADVINAFQKIVSRRVNPVRTPVITITSFQTQHSHNVIPDTVSLSGTYRTLDKEVRSQIPMLMDQTLRGISEMYGSTYVLDIKDSGYPSGFNNEEAYNIALEAGISVVGEDKIYHMPHAMMGGEDFASYQEVIPGNFSLVGVGNVDIDAKYSVHHPKFKADEESFKYGALFFLTIAKNLNF